MKKKKILYIVEDTESAQFRYRVENVIMALKDSNSWEATWVLKSGFSDENLLGIDLVVILRQSDKDGTVSNIIKKTHEKGLKILFDLDDLIFSYKDLPVLMKGTNSKNIAYWMGYVWGIRRIAKKVDGFVTTNGFLAKRLENTFSKPCRVIPNSLNSKQIKTAEESLKNKEHDGFIIGYFSGSPTHTKDLRLVESEIFKFLDRHEDAKLRVVGYMEPSPELQIRIKTKQAEISELVDYLEQMKMMAEIDVNIAPLVVNDFTNCKSELKFFEAAAVETTTIASPTYAFEKAISDGENGFLAKPGEWYSKVEYLYNNPSENQKIAKAACKYAMKHYYGIEFLKEVEESYGYFTKG